VAHSRWVVNASPLILLGKVEQLQLLGALARQIAVPRAVIREVSAKPDGERTIQTLTALRSASIVDDEAPPAKILSWVLAKPKSSAMPPCIPPTAS
jgi:predicted nucleic acid-binding protein